MENKEEAKSIEMPGLQKKLFYGMLAFNLVLMWNFPTLTE
jgi:hypothetical protein